MKRLLTIIVVMLTAVVAVNAQGSVTVSQSAEIDALVNGKKADKKNKKDRQKVESQTEPARPNIKTPDTKQLVVPKLNEHKPEIARPENNTLQPVRTKIVKRLVRKPHIPTWDEIEDTRIVTKRVKKVYRKLEDSVYRCIAVVTLALHTNKQTKQDRKQNNSSLSNLFTYISIHHVGCVLLVTSPTMRQQRRLCEHSERRVIHMLTSSV